jgi:hypothetical protein
MSGAEVERAVADVSPLLKMQYHDKPITIYVSANGYMASIHSGEKTKR